MLDELIAFRVYGDFTWPTNPQGPTVRGYIEIFYKTLEPHPAAVAGPPGVPSLFACFRWVPQARAGDLMPVQLDRWVKQTDAQLTVQLSDATKIIQYRLDDDPAAPTPAAQWPQPRQFLGGAVFEEYAFTAVGYQAAQPFLQWPLTRRFSRGKGNRSGLQPAVILGHVSDKAGVDPTRRGASFGFQLALYTPGAQSTHDDSGGAGTKYPTYAFPFRVRYRPMLFNHRKNQPVEVGWFASGAAEDYQAESEIDFETEWHGQAVQLADKWLGGFGFCRSDGGSDNLYVPRKTLRDRYWPSQGQSVSRDLIGKFAHVDLKLGDQIEVGNDIGPDGTFEVESQGELRNAIRFRRSGANSVITYRSSMRLKQGSDDLAGDIAIRGGQFELADPTIAGLRFPTDSDLVLIEVEIEYQITDIWAFVGDRTGIAADMRLRLGVGTDVDDEPGNDRLGTDGPVNAPWSFKKRLANAVSGIRLSRLGLRGLEPLHAQSLLPEIEIDRAQNYRLALCATLTPRFTTLNTGQTGIVDYLNWSPETDGAVPLWPSFTLSGWPDKPTGVRSGESPLGPAPNETGSLTATMQLPSFAYRSPGADDPSFAVAIVHDARWENARRDCAFRIALSGAQQTALAGRLGGIEFATTADVLPKHDTDDSPDYSFWHFSVAPPIAIRRDGGQSYYASVDAELRLRLSLARLTSLGGDLPRGNRAPDSVPLLIPDDGASGNVPGGLILDATEMLGPQFDRRLVARIVDTGSGTGSAGTYVLLGEKPFSLKRVVSRPL